MRYQFNFVDVLAYYPWLIRGTLLTLALILIGGTLGIALGIVGAWARSQRSQAPSSVRAMFSVYVEVIRNTPFLIQLFFIFFGLPSIGVQLNELEAASLAMVINLGAYSTEIIRAGIDAIPSGQIEAGQSLAMTRLQIFRHIVLRPALQKIWPALSSQVVIVMLGSAACSQISVEDLSFAANFIQSRNFRAFEAYFIATGIYLLLAILVRQAMHGIGWLLFTRKVTR